MTRGAGWRGTGFACVVAGLQEPLSAARSVGAVDDADNRGPMANLPFPGGFSRPSSPELTRRRT
jgi:hypothetical protein